MKEMCTIIPRGSCPNCGHKQFVVHEFEQHLYLTDRDGEIIDSQEIDYSAAGMCVKCGRKYKMLPTHEGFIPATKLRELLFDYSPHLYIENEIKNIDNPMEMKK